MGDLTRALVDLGAAAERRRNARSDLRASVPVIVQELLRHLRAGDSITVEDPIFGDRIYEVERVTWSGETFLTENTYVHPKGASTLVRYIEGSSEGGAVLWDPRENWKVVGDDDPDVLADRSPTGLWLRDEEYPLPLHVATDEELQVFALDAEEVITGFAKRFTNDANAMRRAVEATSKFAPK